MSPGPIIRTALPADEASMQFIEIWGPHVKALEVEGGALVFDRSLDYHYRFGIECSRRSTDFEEDDQLTAVLEIDDAAGTRWRAETDVSPSKLWFELCISDVERESSLEPDARDAWEATFRERSLLRDIYEIRESRSFKKFVLGDRVEEVYEKYLGCRYDVAYELFTLADGSEYASDVLTIRLKLHSHYHDLANDACLEIGPLLYRLFLSDVLGRHPFEAALRFRRSTERGSPQPHVVFVPEGADSRPS